MASSGLIALNMRFEIKVFEAPVPVVKNGVPLHRATYVYKVILSKLKLLYFQRLVKELT